MTRLLLAKISLIFLTLLCGNLFWLLFTNNLQTDPLLTSSPVRIVLFLIFPIILFAVYLLAILCLSFFFTKKYLLFPIIFLSFLSYPFTLRMSAFSIAGSVVISVSIYFFTETFRRSCLLINKRSSLFGQLSFSLTGITVIISLVIAFNFYAVYENTLSHNNIIISDKIFSRSLRPITSAYLDDLKVSDISETFGIYLQKRSAIINEPETKLRTRILFILGLPSASDSETMKTLIERSLTKNIVEIFATYKHQLPILISLGLGLITQTLLTVSSFLAGVIGIGFFRLLVSLGLLTRQKELIEIETIASLG